jgi:hypothetical protein
MVRCTSSCADAGCHSLIATSRGAHTHQNHIHTLPPCTPTPMPHACPLAASRRARRWKTRTSGLALTLSPKQARWWRIQHRRAARATGIKSTVLSRRRTRRKRPSTMVESSDGGTLHRRRHNLLEAEFTPQEGETHTGLCTTAGGTPRAPIHHGLEREQEVIRAPVGSSYDESRSTPQATGASSSSSSSSSLST